MIAWIWSPFVEHDFMRNALLQCLILSASFPVVGLLLVNRRLSLLGDSLSHAMLPGVVIASALGLQSFWALLAGGSTVVFALLVMMIVAVRARRDWPDTALASLTIFALAMGMLLAFRFNLESEVLHLLFGDVLAVDSMRLGLTAGMGFLTWLAVLYFFRLYVLALIDPIYFSLSVPMGWGRWLGLIALLTLHLTLGFAALGSLMTVGLLIVPVLIGLRWQKGVLETLLLSSFFGGVSSFFGLLFSFYGKWPAGPSIVATACVILFVSTLSIEKTKRVSLSFDR